MAKVIYAQHMANVERQSLPRVIHNPSRRASPRRRPSPPAHKRQTQIGRRHMTNNSHGLDIRVHTALHAQNATTCTPHDLSDLRGRRGRERKGCHRRRRKMLGLVWHPKTVRGNLLHTANGLPLTITISLFDSLGFRVSGLGHLKLPTTRLSPIQPRGFAFLTFGLGAWVSGIRLDVDNHRRGSRGRHLQRLQRLQRTTLL